MNFQPLKDFLDFYLPMLGVPGSDTIIYKNHQEIFRYSAGYDNKILKTPVKQDGFYNIYSCSKVALATAVMQLVERGELVVTDPVYAYIPEFKNITVAVTDESGNIIGTRPATKPMLIHHLLTMTSGLDYDLNADGIKRVQAQTDGRAPTLDICRAIAEKPLQFDPGARYSYSLSHDVLGGIVELVSGQKFSEYMKENIFDPLGMAETAYHIDMTKRARFATQYAYNEQTGTSDIIPIEKCDYRFGTEYDSAGAGIVSTVSDYILLMDALANDGVGKSGNRILSRRAIDVMRTNALTPSQLSEFGIRHCMGYGYGYGVRMNLDPSISGNLVPKGAFGWDGAKLCIALADPENRIAVFHAEHMGGLHSVVIPRFRNLVYSCID